MKKLSKAPEKKRASGTPEAPGGRGRDGAQSRAFQIPSHWYDLRAGWKCKFMGPLHPLHQKSQVWFQQPVGKKLSRWFPCLLKSEPRRWENFLNRPCLYWDKTLGRTGFLSMGWEGGREGNAITREIWLKAAVSSGAAESRDSSLLPQRSQPGHKGWKKWVGRGRQSALKDFRIPCTEKMPPVLSLLLKFLQMGTMVAYSFCSSFHSERLSSRRCWGTEDPRLKEKKEASENREDLPLWTPLRLHPDLLPLSPEAGWPRGCLRGRGKVQTRGCTLESNVLSSVPWSVSFQPSLLFSSLYKAQVSPLDRKE